MAASSVAVTAIVNAQSTSAAAGYILLHGSSERFDGLSTPKSILAALRLVEEITRPPTIADALTPGVRAFGSPAGAQLEANIEAEEETQNSAGDLNGALGE